MNKSLSLKKNLNMWNKHFEKITKLLEKSVPKLATKHRLEFKNVFGAIGGYVNGHIFISCGRFGVALRLPPKTLTELFQEKDISQLRYFPKGHVKKEYVVIPQRIINDQIRFKKLLNKSIQFVLRLD